MSTFTAGLIGLVLIAAFSYLAYTKFANPFAGQYTVTATFTNAVGIEPGALVRIAGVNVGTVTAVNPDPGCSPKAKDQSACKAAQVQMT
ncbi:MAG TPA: MlaD family protein, partial [Streptosporangiaceae bacterium]|nr:MlaD family protein [Streptosporangiaceae bacterium]